jgi:hypothetical protein
MHQLLNQYEDQIKKMSKDQKDQLIVKLLEQKTKMRTRAKESAVQKRTAGIKILSIEIHENYINEFRDLQNKTHMNKTDLLIDMINCYKSKLNSESDQNGNR